VRCPRLPPPDREWANSPRQIHDTPINFLRQPLPPFEPKWGGRRGNGGGRRYLTTAKPFCQISPMPIFRRGLRLADRVNYALKCDINDLNAKDDHWVVFATNRP